MPVTNVWRWNTAEEPEACLEDVEWANDGAVKAWINENDPSDVVVRDDEPPEDPDQWPVVHHGGEP